MKNFDELLKAVESHPTRKVAIAVAEDSSVISAAMEARKNNIAECIFVGDQKKIAAIAKSLGASDKDLSIVHEPDPIAAVGKAVQLVANGKADILMKGYIHTDDFLRGVLDKTHGLRTGSIMSHVFVAEIRAWDRLIFITDAAMNIAPDLEQKAAIVMNAVYLSNIFGLEDPKVAALAAVELVNPNMPATLDAAALGTMADRSQYVPHCQVDGPFGLDNAISQTAAEHKKITGPVAGQADILLVPDIECGNVFAKSLVYFGGHRLVGLLVGAKAPVVLTSRADSMESKMLSIAAAVLMVNMHRNLKLKIGKVHY
ncbi:MAG: bifunctional enoyl-CoA hydratase/phosphate acetyltransferase [Phycisphaerae bacterium]|nr:bifunctional enoyl-CoA hydratase/phosphate acetyltransferase [Phycisphaerae bacterium]